MKLIKAPSIIILFLLLFPVAPVHGAVDQITLFIPAFEGPGALGRNVATVINLQIWQTFRRYPWPNNPNNLDFGRGLIVWDKEPLKSQSHTEAEQAAKDSSLLAQLVLWGKAYLYGGGVVVQTNLSMPLYDDFRERRLEIWEISFVGRSIEVDVPRRRLEMSSIVLKQELVEKYSLPSGLKLYADRTRGDPIGEVGDAYTGIQFEPGLAMVRSGSTQGWVRLPELGKKPSEVVDFVAGVVRTLRGDWEGAASFMRRVVENAGTKTPLKADAYLYWGMALERLGESGRSVIEKAFRLNPYSQISVKYLIMCDLSALKRLPISTGSEVQKSRLIERLNQTILENLYLFPKGDLWLQTILELLEEMKRR
jgi:hypothetical protein